MAWKYEVQCSKQSDVDAYNIYFIRRSNLAPYAQQVAQISKTKALKWVSYAPYSQMKPTIRISGLMIHKMSESQAQELINALTGITVPQPTVETA